MANESDDHQKPKGFLNAPLFLQQAGNQALIGSGIWTGGVSYQVLAQHSHFGPAAVALGIAGLVPLLGLSKGVETSESPVFAGLNLSTEQFLLRLLGDRPQPALALGVTAGMATLTGVVEETIFRGQLLPALAQWSTGLGIDGGVLAGAVLSTVVFAALHANPLSFFSGSKEGIQDNLVLLGYQLVTGAIFASLYLATGNLAVPIVAHVLYDFVTFYQTHLDVTSQIQYASANKLLPSTNYLVEKKWIDARGEEFVQQAREAFYLMDKNQDGVVSRKEFRVGLFAYSIDLSKADSAKLANAVDEDESGDIDFGEYLEFIGPHDGKTKEAINEALFAQA